MAQSLMATSSTPLQCTPDRLRSLPASKRGGWFVVVTGCLITAIVMVISLTLLYQLFPAVAGSSRNSVTQLSRGDVHRAPGPREDGTDVLVMYIFSNTDPEYINNLKFFLREGVRDGDGCEYIFVVNRSPGDQEVKLPQLPKNARYLHHSNTCYDWGTFGWVLKTENIDLSQYKYFIFMNSSVRGPFVPTYLKGRLHWADILISKLSDEIKLVGPTINCEGSPFEGNVTAHWRRNPHVQSYVVATDQVGMLALMENGKVFECYESMWDTIYHSELGASLVMLEAGYNIDSLMVRYQGVDWRDERNWGCNMQSNPYGANYLDGASLEAMEVMFVKVKGFLLQRRWPYVLAAAKFDAWYKATEAGVPEVHLNEYKSRPALFQLPLVLTMAAYGHECFDCELYMDKNLDLPRAWTCVDAFTHFINFGQFEGRKYKLKCEPSPERFLPYNYQPFPAVNARSLHAAPAEHPLLPALDAATVDAGPDAADAGAARHLLADHLTDLVRAGAADVSEAAELLALLAVSPHLGSQYLSAPARDFVLS